MAVADELLRHGKVEHAFIGIQPAELTPEVARQLHVGRSTGVLVYAVERHGPADRAGVELGGVLITLAGESLDSVEDLFVALRHHLPARRSRSSSCEAVGATPSRFTCPQDRASGAERSSRRTPRAR